MRVAVPRRALILLVGVSGAGKSTFAREHFRSHEVISSDFCRALVCDDQEDQGATVDGFEVVHLIADKRLGRGRLTVVDATNLKSADRKPFIDLAFGHRAPLVAIVFRLNLELCWQRNCGRKRTVPRDVIDRQERLLARSLRELPEEVDMLFELRSPEEVMAVDVDLV
jgi:protein phosphatase